MKNFERIIPVILTVVAGLILFISFTPKSSERSEAEMNYEIVKKWDLPEILKEVSGIAWIGDNRIACVQDEDGKIFVYNLNSSKVENSVTFAGAGDYEGITIIEEDAYILRSDGVIFKVTGFRNADPQVNKYLTRTNQLPGINIEGLCADPANNRLLLAIKARNNFSEHKEVYSFDLNKKDTGEHPLFTIELSDPIFEVVNEQLEEKFAPGEIGVHPHSGKYYILDGSRPKLLITEKDGTPKKLYMLNPNDFGNPEGLTFNPEGDLFISNEAEDAPANILQVSLKVKSK